MNSSNQLGQKPLSHDGGQWILSEDMLQHLTPEQCVSADFMESLTLIRMYETGNMQALNRWAFLALLTGIATTTLVISLGSSGGEKAEATMPAATLTDDDITLPEDANTVAENLDNSGRGSGGENAGIDH